MHAASIYFMIEVGMAHPQEWGSKALEQSPGNLIIHMPCRGRDPCKTWL